MNDMIDLGRYVRAVIRRWPVVLALAIIGALTGFVISRVLLPVYEAGTTLLVTTPKLRADFDSRFRSTLELGLSTALNRTLFNLIENRELEAQVVQVMGNALTPEEQAPGALMERIGVTQVGGDTSYFQIKARHSDPAMAQQLAKTWASVYVAQVNELYGFSLEAEGDIGTSLEAAKANLGEAAKANLGEAEDRLEAFQRETGVGLVDNVQYPASFSRQSGLADVRNLFGLYERYGAAGEALETKNLTLGSYLAARDTVNLLIGQAEALQGQGNAIGGRAASRSGVAGGHHHRLAGGRARIAGEVG
jgi:capsular polysaccharide biosynthesis protein